jgi:predicted ATP-dependent protease
MQRGTLLIDSGGEKVGQVNGLSVFQLGGFSFGHPNRITARVRLGGGKVIDIEREVELGGPIHSKSVLILSGFLAGRYIPDKPLSLSASLVFEQSYGGVEGDSASSAELYALLSALAEAAHQSGIGGDRFSQSARRSPGHWRRERENRRLLRFVQARGLTGNQGF